MRSAAAALVSGFEVRIVDADPTNLECLLSGRIVRVDVVAQATAQAWTEYDTMVVHQVQAYGPGSVHAPSQLPKTLRGLSSALGLGFGDRIGGFQGRSGSFKEMVLQAEKQSELQGKRATKRLLGIT